MPQSDHRCVTVWPILFFFLLFVPGSARIVAQHTVARMDHALHPGSGSAMRLAGPAGLPDTVRVLAIMVEFQPDADSRTSGTGRFGTVFPYDYGADIVDAMPHDKNYFQAHLTFLANYVRKASGGRTRIRATVMDSIVTVSKSIADYSFRKGSTEKPVADLAVEAWQAADRRFPNFDFSAYDMFVVFHAGRGRDIDLSNYQSVDPTPLDIPSLSFTLSTFRKYLGDSFEGISVQNGATHITNCSILPTTDSREISLITGQTALLELSINGLVAASFGTYAGLPDLFDTQHGTTGIGRFGLMDPEAIFAYAGICPPAPSAWEKQFLGWTIPREATVGREDYYLTAQRFDQPSTTDVIKVPITGKEYWLLENRQRDPGSNGQNITMLTGGKEFELRFAKDTTGFDSGTITALKGVITDVEDLDWSLWGGIVQSESREVRVNGGILMWHIDESIIEAHLADNSVNNDADHRGVDLEQAGGPQDIGKPIPSIFGTTTGTGSPLDFWFEGNISPLYKNSFGTSTTPDSRANSGAFTHITIDNFGPAGPIMSLRIAIGDDVIKPVSGFPVDLRQWLPSGYTLFRTQTADVDTDGKHEIFVLATPSTGVPAPTDTTYLFGFRQDGTPILQNPILGRFGSVRSSGYAPLIGDITGDGISEIVIPGTGYFFGFGTNNPFVLCLSATDSNLDRRYDEQWIKMYQPSPFGANPDGSILMQNGTLLYTFFSNGNVNGVSTTSGTPSLLFSSPWEADPVIRIAADGTSGTVFGDEYLGRLNVRSGSREALTNSSCTSARQRVTTARNRVCSDFDGDGVNETAAFIDGLCLQSTGADPSHRESAAPANLYSYTSARKTLAVADVDGDGKNDVILADSAAVYVHNYALGSIDRYPLTGHASYVLAARLPGQRQDALFVVGDKQLTQLTTGAMIVPGFPVPLPEDASVVLFPYGPANNATLGIAATGADGRLQIFDTHQQVDENSFLWRSIFADEMNSNYAPPARAGQPISSAFFPESRCYNWPNPVYDKSTKIRCFVSQNADISVKIYDLAGDRVDELHAKALGGTDNEIDWDVSSIQSGMYLAHVSATGAGLTGEKIIKIAVVK